MWLTLHHLFVATYLLTPLLALLLAVFGRRGSIGTRLIGLFSTLFVGLALGTLITVYYAHLLQNRPGPRQLFFCVYLACSALLIIRAVDAVLLTLGMRTRRRGWIAASLAGRAVLLMMVGIPFFLSGLLVYRPKGVSPETPASVLKADYQQVTFRSSDAVALSGWWIAARGRNNPQPGTGKTVIVCGDDTSTRAQLLKLIRPLRNVGFNVLMIDLRGQGNSDGYLTSMGDLERRDVLAAVRWVRQAHAAETQSIAGLGVGSGGAALIAAAVDPSADGQAIEQLAVYGTFDDAQGVLSDLSRDLFIRPLNRWLPAMTLPLASATVGADLRHFSPAELVQKFWPRPIFVIHGVGDEVIDFDRGQALFNAASFPKQRLWIQKDRAGTLDDVSAARSVRDFFLLAKPTPAI